MAVATILLASGCQGAAVKANQQELQQQRAELDRLKREIQALKAPPATSYPSAPSNACDETVMREASRKGGERLAAADFTPAIAYYQDAVSACPQSARTHLNLARSYEAAGQNAAARAQYQLAASSSRDQDPALAGQVRDALARLK